MNQHRLLLMTTALLVWAAAPALAESPKIINMQSILRDSSGNPAPDGPYLVKFTIWDDPVASGGGNEKWNSGFQNVSIQSGQLLYHLGSNVPFPEDLFAGPDTALFLGLTVGVDPEMSPRIKLTSVAFSQHALRSDTSSEAAALGGQTPSFYRDWNNLTNVPAGFADGTDDNTNTTYSAGSGLQLAGATFSVPTGGITSAHIATNAVTVDEIATDAVGQSEIATGGVASPEIADGSITAADISDNTIIDADINAGAAIDVAKISGTAVNLTSTQTISGEKRFGDSTMVINNTGIFIGAALPPSPASLVFAYREFASTASRWGTIIDVDNNSTGTLTGLRANVGNTTDHLGLAYGIYADVDNALSDNSSIYGGFFDAGASSKTSGTVYGVYGRASAGTGAGSRAVYGIESGSGSNYAGFFVGTVNVNGTLTKSGGSFRIDHPMDPSNKYLQHSFVESPDMMNVYNGNAQLDGMGRAMVELPDYFETLNRDFRYQLTPLGSSQPGLYIEQEVVGNRFVIAGGAPLGRVSWQITGVRQDPWAQANRIEVEVEKTGEERGKYVHYEEYGVDLSQAVDGEELQRALDAENEERAED